MILSGVMETTSTDCQAPGFLPLLLSHCQSQSGCSLLVSVTTVRLSPSCPQSPGPGLRAEVRYQCRPDRFSTELTCSSGCPLIGRDTSYDLNTVLLLVEIHHMT